MNISISHNTAYSYDSLVRASIQYLRLTPQASPRQRILSWNLDLPRSAREQVDPYGNILHVLTLDEPHNAIHIHASGQVDIDESSEFELFEGSPLPFLRSTPLTQADAALRAFAEQQVGATPDRAAFTNLMQALHAQMPYTPGSTRVESTAAEAFAGGAGVCQDHAHVFLACVRSLGVPARYVSGYLFTEDDSHLASHAWAEVWLNGAWYSFDVTNGLARPERHLKLAVGLDYLDACPVRGVRRGGGAEQMHARVLVSPTQLQGQVVQQQQQQQ